MPGICGHIPGVTCSNCRPAPSSSWVTLPPSDLGRIANALEKLVDALTTSDRYFANEERQREAAEPEWPEGFDGFRENHGWGLLTRAEKQVAIERWLADQKLTDDEREAKAAEARAKFAAVVEQLKRAQQALTPEPDPLDENDHRDRLDGAGTRWTNASDGCWAAGTHHVLELASLVGPLTFAPDAEPDPLDENDHRDRLIADRRRIVRHGQGHWHTPATSGTWCDADCTEMSLRHWGRVYGPLAFATDAAQEDSSTHYYPTNIDRAPDGTAWSWGVAECHCDRPWRHE